MSNLLHFEFIKLFKSVSFYICGACMILIGMFSFGALALADSFMFAGGLSLADIGYSGISFMNKIMSVSDFPVLIGILVSIGICSEYHSKTFKNIWSRGFSRAQVFIAKSIVYSVAAIMYAAVLMILGLLIGTVLWGIGPINTNVILSLLIQLVMSVAYAMIFVMVAFVFKNTAISVVIAVSCPSMITLGGTILDYILEWRQINIKVSDYLLSANLSFLAIGDASSFVMARAFLIAVAYIITGLTFGLYSMRKDEI